MERWNLRRRLLMSRRTISGMRLRSFFALLLLAASVPAGLCAKPNVQPAAGRHVVLVVWDGLRPDFVSETTTPSLWRLAQAGVNFSLHHSVYPTLTNVNSAAMATGVFAHRSGLLANYEFRPELDANKFIRTDHLPAVQRGDALSGGRYLGAATIAELVQAAGGRTAIAGSKTISLLHDR